MRQNRRQFSNDVDNRFTQLTAIYANVQALPEPVDYLCLTLGHCSGCEHLRATVIDLGSFSGPKFSTTERAVGMIT